MSEPVMVPIDIPLGATNADNLYRALLRKLINDKPSTTVDKCVAAMLLLNVTLDTAAKVVPGEMPEGLKDLLTLNSACIAAFAEWYNDRASGNKDPGSQGLLDG